MINSIIDSNIGTLSNNICLLLWKKSFKWSLRSIFTLCNYIKTDNNNLFDYSSNSKSIYNPNEYHNFTYTFKNIQNSSSTHVK